MSFARRYQSIKDMILASVLDAQMARDIVRKSGLLEEIKALGAAKSLPIWRAGSYNAQSNYGYFFFNAPAGVYIYPPYTAPPTRQHTLTDLTNVAYVRIFVYFLGYGELDSRVAFIPIYTNDMEPQVTGDLGNWIAPDGRTLLQWQDDVETSMAPWRPIGCQLDPVGEGPFGDTFIAVPGEWAAPPVDTLEDPTNVLIGVAAIVRDFTGEIRVGDVSIQAATAPTSEEFNALFFP